jgi:hypothetical protein
MKYKNIIIIIIIIIIKLRLPEIQLLAVAPTQLKFSVVKDHDEPTVLLMKHYFVRGSVSISEQSYPLRLCWGKR